MRRADDEGIVGSDQHFLRAGSTSTLIYPLQHRLTRDADQCFTGQTRGSVTRWDDDTKHPEPTSLEKWPAAIFQTSAWLPAAKGCTHASHGLAREGQPWAGGSAQRARLLPAAPRYLHVHGCERLL